jgi:hypothetical protein
VPVTIVGVRHHSPACARLVAKVLREQRPALVLIEGPSNMNDRLDELALGHELPVALFSFAVDAAGGRRSSFYPFASYSPEWVALTEARRLGATARFIDLPAEDPAFDDLPNVYSDHHLRASAQLHTLAARLGFEDTDTLWEHLFEHEPEPAPLAARLAAYFAALRGDEPGSPSDQRRERFMAQHVAWAAAQAAGGGVVVICGGYHAPVLERTFASLPPAPPHAAPRPGHHGIYLVPFSNQRLDAFSGYAAGMPSPAFCSAVWEHGPAAGGERMLTAAIQALRAHQQRVSVADAIAATTMAQGLARLRGHFCPGRTDLLDGLAAALVKEALQAPLPWARRGVPAARTHPVLLLLLQAFAGEQRGRLAAGTPRPPLVDDVHAELARLGVATTRATVKLAVPLQQPAAPLSAPLAAPVPTRPHLGAVLHRLRILGVPGVRRLRAPRFTRGQTLLGESWELTRGLDFEPALIEAAIYGATLEQAAVGKLEEAARLAADSRLVELVHDAALAGLGGLSEGLLRHLLASLGRQPDLSVLGQTLAGLLQLADSEQQVLALATLAPVIDGAFARCVWLTESIQGAGAAAVKGHVEAIVALRDTVRFYGRSGRPTAAAARSLAELAERRRRDPEAPAYLRGAATGLRAALTLELGASDESAAPPLSDDELVRAFRGLREPSDYGDFLLGLFALAREELGQNESLFAAILSAVEELAEPTFLGALPALRQAMNYFPPRERVPIAERVLARYGGARASVLGPIDVELAVSGRHRELRADERGRRFGLLAEPPP